MVAVFMLAVGAVVSVVSTVTVAASALEIGPVLLATSVTAFAPSRTITVPSDIHEAKTVNLIADALDGLITQPVAVPTLEKSADSIPLTNSENVSVYASKRVDDGVLGEDQVADGVVSTVTVAASEWAFGQVLLATSDTAFAASREMTVPSDAQTTTTLTTVPEVSDGVNLQPVAVPAFEKSPESISLINSENVSV